MLGFIKTLGLATERLFRRSYQNPNATPSSALDSPEQVEKLRQMVQGREAEIAHLTAVLESIGEGVIMQDIDSRIIMMNEAARSMLGSQRAFWESELARLSEKSQTVRKFAAEFEPLGEPVRVEINNRILAGQVAAVSDSDGNRFGTVIVLRDVTRATLAERLKDDFITQVSHELRTPLTAIKGMSDVLLSQPPDRPPNRRFLEAISRNVDVLDHMIVELLDISEISSGTFAVRQEELLLDDLVWGVIRGLRPRWERAGLEVQVMTNHQDQTTIVGDNRRLHWALGHLLENAINYTLKDGVILFRIGEVTPQGRVLIRVEDSGVGISDMDLPHIFNRFYRGQARTPSGKTIDPRGLGQGLFIARAVAEAHNGYLAVESKPGAGSVFTLALPLRGSKSIAIEPPTDQDTTVPNPALALPANTTAGDPELPENGRQSR
jgi:two-component system phosphate regulon sensor histidine kinase PhoR